MRKIVVVEQETGEVVHVIHCNGKTDRQVERVNDGLNINLNHEKFFTRIVDKDHE